MGRPPSSQRGATDHVSSTGPIGSLGGRSVAARSAERRGKAPPIDPFNGEKPDLRLDDWLPNLERAALWNSWTDDELLLQFAGHLRGRALLEWNLLDREDKSSYKIATDALRTRLDPGGRALAAQDFRHTFQRDNELVGDFIRRLERTFQLAYGRDKISPETRAATRSLQKLGPLSFIANSRKGYATGSFRHRLSLEPRPTVNSAWLQRMRRNDKRSCRKERDIQGEFQQRRQVDHLGDHQHNLPTIRQPKIQRQIHPQVHSPIVDKVGAATLVAALSIWPGTALRGRVRAEADKMEVSQQASQHVQKWCNPTTQDPLYLQYRMTP